MRNRFRGLWITSVSLWLLATSSGQAQLVSNFEPPAFAGSGTGTLLTGQQGWYIPPPPVAAGSVDFNVFTYAGNSLGFPANSNSTGGTQFVAGVSAGGTNVARGQHDVDFSIASQWTLSTDVVHRFNGTLPTAQNLGSFSLSNLTLLNGFRQLIGLHTWVDTATATNWNMGYLAFDAAGAPIGGVANVPQSPGAAWNGLAIDNWYRESYTVDFSTNQILSVSITDITTGIVSTANPVGWFMLGGAAGVGTPLPNAVRYFAGGATGNVAGWDNLSVQPIPEPSSLALVGIGLAGAIRASRKYRRK